MLCAMKYMAKHILLYYRSTPRHEAVRELRHGGTVFEKYTKTHYMDGIINYVTITSDDCDRPVHF